MTQRQLKALRGLYRAVRLLSPQKLTTRTIPSRKQKDTPKRQRKRKEWLKEV